MKKFAISLGIVMATIITFAQEDTENKDPRAKAILENLSKKNKSYSTISANFEYKLSNADEGIDETQKGTLVLKGNKYKLGIAGQEVICNGQVVYTYLKDADEVQINNMPSAEEEADNFFNPSNIFNIYEHGFKYKYMNEDVKNGKKVDVINLYPEAANDKPYHTIQLIIDKEAVQINSLVVKGKDGNTYTYSLSKFVTNQPINDSDFNFDTSKIGDVIDLRD